MFMISDVWTARRTEETDLMEAAAESKLGKLVAEEGGRLFCGSSACSSSSMRSFALGRDMCTSLELTAELTADLPPICVGPDLAAVVVVVVVSAIRRMR